MNSEQRLLVYGPVIVENVDVWAELKIDYRHCCLYHWEKNACSMLKKALQKYIWRWRKCLQVYLVLGKVVYLLNPGLLDL